MATLPNVRRDDLDAATSVLVFDSPFDPPERVCPSLCRSAEAEPEHVLSVLFAERPERYLRSWARSGGARPERVRIVSVDPGSTPGTAPESDLVVGRVSSPGDLTALGVEITTALSDWEGEERSVAVCFDSLTPLLQYVDVDRAVRFLRELTNLFETVDATAHVHVDPAAHDRQTIGALVAQFDEVVDLAESQQCREAD